MPTKIKIAIALVIVGIAIALFFKFGWQALVATFGSLFVVAAANKGAKVATKEHKEKTEARNERVEARKEESEKAVEDAKDRPPPPSTPVSDKTEEGERLDSLGDVW